MNARLARARWAEELAATWYRRQGFEILARNWTMHGGELDIVARRGRTVVICEVKARANNNFGTALEAMSDTKQRRVRRAGFAYLSACGISGVDVRFDVAAVTGTSLEMWPDAF